MKCIISKCDKTVTPFVIEKANAVDPQTCDISHLRELFGYFQYRTPNTSSYQCETLDTAYHQSLYHEMVKSWNQENISIIPFNATFDQESPSYALSGNSVCSYCKRFLCKRAKPYHGNPETDFDCLLRHIRNSLAHGRVFVIHGGTSIKILLEDYDTKNKVITARIICNQSDLTKWRALINKYLKKQREENGQTNS